MRRQARSRRAVSRVLRRSDPDAKRRVTRLGRRPRPSRLNAGAARKRLRRRDEQSAAPKRGARDQGVARGARRTRRSVVRPPFLTFLRATRRTRGEPIAPRAPPRLTPEGKPGRRAAMPRAAPAARTTAHALSPPSYRIHSPCRLPLLPPPARRSRVAGRGR